MQCILHNTVYMFQRMRKHQGSARAAVEPGPAKANSLDSRHVARCCFADWAVAVMS